MRLKVRLIKTNVLSEVNWIKRPLLFSLTTTKEWVIKQSEVEPVSSELPHAVHSLPQEWLCALLCQGSALSRDETFIHCCMLWNGREILAPCCVPVSCEIKGIGRQASKSYKGQERKCLAFAGSAVLSRLLSSHGDTKVTTEYVNEQASLCFTHHLGDSETAVSCCKSSPTSRHLEMFSLIHRQHKARWWTTCGPSVYYIQ